MVIAVSDLIIPNIHQELIRLWDQEQGQDKVWASLFSLVVYVRGTARLQEYEELIKKVVSRFPSRVILIITDEHPGTDDLRVTVSSETVGEGDLTIFCEMIRIQANGSYIERIPYLVIPHILPDLPVYLLWTEDPSQEQAILPHLTPYASRVIFDADSTENLQIFASSILSLTHAFHCEVGDLNWTSLSGWRRLLMERFNSRESFISLGSSHHIILTYNKLEGQLHQQTEIQAAYLQAWLASRLNWSFESFELVEGNIRISYRRPMNAVVVLLKPTHNPTLPIGAVVSIEISCLLNEGHHLMQCQSDASHVHVQYSDRQRCDIPWHEYLPSNTQGQEIVQEIFYLKGKAHYLGMLGVLAQIPWRLG